MSDPVLKFRPIAVLGISKEPVHVPEAIVTINTVLGKLGSSGDNILTAAELTTQQGNADNLLTNQQALASGGSVNSRNNAYTTCFTDHKDNMLKVQIGSNAIADFDLAAEYIKRNGFEIKKDMTTPASNDIKIKRKKNSDTTIIAEVKAPNAKTNFSIDWEITYDDGETWIHLNSTPVCSRDIKNCLTSKTIKARARYNIGTEDPTEWMISNSLNL